MPDTKPLLLLIGSGQQPYRETTLRSLAAAGNRIALVDVAPPTWQAPYVETHACAKLGDLDYVRVAVAKIARDHQISGVLTFDPSGAIAAARVAHDRKLPTASPLSVRVAMSRAAARAALDTAWVPSARWQRVDDLPQATAAATKIKYPVVLKPAMATGGARAIRVDHSEDLPAALAQCRADIAAQRQGWGMIIEECFEGTQVGVTVAMHRGGAHVVAVARTAIGPGPCLEETAHLVSWQESTTGHPAARVAVAALQTIGFTHGIAHVTVQITGPGPRVIECKPYLPGDMIPQLIEQALGVDLVRAAADLAQGRIPQLAPSRQKTAAIGFTYRPAGGVTDVGVNPAVARQPWCERIVHLDRPGAPVATPPGLSGNTRLGYAIVTGETSAQVRTRLVEATRAIRTDIQALPTVPSLASARDAA